MGVTDDVPKYYATIAYPTYINQWKPSIWHFDLLIQISLRSSTILYFSADRPNCSKFPTLKCAHIYLWREHSKFHNTSNHPPPATDSGRTARTPLYPPMKTVPHTPSPSPPLFFLSRTEEPVPVLVTDMRYNSLLWIRTLNTLTWPDLTWSDISFDVNIIGPHIPINIYEWT